jgi:hypothetical protein
MKELTDIYKNTLNRNLQRISKIIEEFGIHDKVFESNQKSLKLSSEHIIRKWASGRKYLRTLFVRDAFGNYPKDLLEFSLLVDSQINILDDLFDEKIDKVSIFLYVLELGRLLSSEKDHELLSNRQIRAALRDYFLKIIIMGLSEDIYTKLISDETNIKKLINNCVDVYNIRALDIDFFIQLPLIYENVEELLFNKILFAGRIFRSINLIKKDIKDYNHDLQSRKETPITILYRRFGKEFGKYLKLLLNHYSKIPNNIKSNNERINGFKKMIVKEIKVINKLIEEF